ncbi:MAG: glycosyltransferase family 4 protein [Solirubrobacterales bacterium]
MSAFTERLNGLRWRLRATRRLWSKTAEPGDTFLAPEPQTGMMLGEVDVPGPGAEIVGPVFFVRGWALFPDSPTATVDVRVNGRSVGNARLAYLRPDVAESLDVPQAISSGFELAIERAIVELPEGSAILEMIPRSVSGQQQVLGPVEVVIGDPRGEDPPRRGGDDDLPAPPLPTPIAPAKEGPGVLVVTHQLNLGGAQLYLMDLLRELAGTLNARFTVASALDGILRHDLEEMGIPVHIFGALHDNLSSHVGRLEELASWTQGRDFDVAFLNTATVFTIPGAEVAELLGIPYVWSIHESFHPSVLWSVLSPHLRERAEGTLPGAHALVFETKATRSLYQDEAGKARCLTLPYGLDLKPIEAWRASFDMPQERSDAGIPEDAELVVCIGTIEPRKAQNTLAQAFDLIAAQHPRAHLAFVGGRKDPECEALEELIEGAAHGDRMHLIPLTPDIHSWYGMADLLVCASDVESMPRTVLEAMAWETPVLGTRVFGLPEVITEGETGWLCEPRDLGALAGGLERALSSSPDERRRIGKRARVLVEDRHSLPRYTQAVADLLQEAITDKQRSPAPRRR